MHPAHDCRRNKHVGTPSTVCRTKRCFCMRVPEKEPTGNYFLFGSLATLPEHLETPDPTVSRQMVNEVAPAYRQTDNNLNEALR